MSAKLQATIIGATGYTGGELLRILNHHPHVEVVQITSRTRMGEHAHVPHPNLRNTRVGSLTFIRPEDVRKSDVIFLCLPHGEAVRQIDHWATLADVIVDLSADFRLRQPADYEKWYGAPHPAPHWLERFVYGLPELTRDRLRGARYASGVGCNATATNLALLPLARAELLDFAQPIIADVKVGSSEGGAESSPASHHPERSGAVRSYAPAGHRHQAEVEQMFRFVLGDAAPSPHLHMTVTAIEMVRGVLATVHAFLKQPAQEKELWRVFRACYKDEPFVRIVKSNAGIYRLPEPKILAGSNWADVGFALSADGRKVTLLCAIDNLMKGAAGSAVQALNVMMGWDERAGLEFPGLHP
ncbi:MAG: N-acetyl-gamma-glutamyl-phosphate reductase [Thermoflexales bacterium]|nr:N-acetyl-gamma-glutamyl-phosphate reductase [Thermoflexales bacterium]MCS7324229.1 N-acetyl-gamma-glutamyl-phosphate reductase [Thermoflexales bacterium]MDW8053614.1 N-acetyl-gamma-glutamyl-phosphate reductase [Anaerolineae bacterium]MDW8292096.1 N-acetyl-gamma-glutamyl-phosphate reductase [Anaerolineae bacterium]